MYICYTTRDDMDVLNTAKFDVSNFYKFLSSRDPATYEDYGVKVRAALAKVEQVYRNNAAAYRSKGPFLLGKLSL